MRRQHDGAGARTTLPSMCAFAFVRMTFSAAAPAPLTAPLKSGLTATATEAAAVVEVMVAPSCASS